MRLAHAMAIYLPRCARSSSQTTSSLRRMLHLSAELEYAWRQVSPGFSRKQTEHAHKVRGPGIDSAPSGRRAIGECYKQARQSADSASGTDVRARKICNLNLSTIHRAAVRHHESALKQIALFHPRRVLVDTADGLVATTLRLGIRPVIRPVFDAFKRYENRWNIGARVLSRLRVGRAARNSVYGHPERTPRTHLKNF